MRLAVFVRSNNESDCICQNNKISFRYDKSLQLSQATLRRPVFFTVTSYHGFLPLFMQLKAFLCKGKFVNFPAENKHNKIYFTISRMNSRSRKQHTFLFTLKLKTALESASPSSTFQPDKAASISQWCRKNSKEIFTIMLPYSLSNVNFVRTG